MFNEVEVVTKILKGDMAAFKLLVKQYERLVFYVIDRLVSDHGDTADVCQEVFIKVFKNLYRFNFQSKLSTWIASIAYHTAINYVNKSKRMQSNNYPGEIENIHFTDENPENLLAKKEVARYVEMLIAQMPEKYKTVLTLYHLSEFSCAEIEDITGIPEGTVKSHLFRARKLLKEKIQAYLKKDVI